ncbi:RING-variant domain-containing protein 2 [Elsinoe australis]|uniref:RING-variant domain-containing protein 2 n=1 Tax=Elsinoe australis TaxID=40998 RepID=A0A4U7BC37_9PEZI|nr:RING-variant domain-containing protein 2 [Elsinoe australis]
MASMPQQPASWRRASPEQTPADSSQSQSQTETGSSSRSTVSDDSQMVMLNTPSPVETPRETSDIAPRPPSRRQDTDVKKCWICFADETEDTPETSQWRSPCPCALVAHEECLLDWIADMESPSSRKRSLAPPQILCPQCKTEIHLARPWNPLVEGVKALERVSAKMVTPSAIVVALSTIREACVLHGMHTVLAVFGVDDAKRILQPFLRSRLFEIWDYQARIEEWRDHWRLHLGLPLITPMLVLSRTSLADSVLPVLPIVFFATQGDSDQPVDLSHWPPSASLTFAVLPYIRGVYNAYYNKVWSAHEKRWLKEIQPRTSQPAPQNNQANDEGQNQENADVVAEEEGVFEIRVDGNFWDDWDANDRGEEPQPQPDQQQADNRAAIDALINAAHANNERQDQQPQDQQPQAHPLNAPPLDADAGPDVRLNEPPEHVDIPRNPPAPPPQQQQAQPAAQAQAQGGERRLSISTTGLAEKILGALLFPTIASMSGELLRMCLPASWTTAAATGTWRAGLGGRTKATGLLQEKWGRSVVGGCLFVVVKDAVMLYVRWKMAQQHRRRRVLDYTGKKVRRG